MGKLRNRTRKGLNRRTFLKHVGGSAAGVPLIAACGSSTAPLAPSAPVNPGQLSIFQHGIASGDPTSDRVMFWTRLSTVTADTPVSLSLYSDPALTKLISSHAGTATASRDYNTKLDIGGLSPGTTYYYRFAAAGAVSAIGRTRTAPLGGASRLRFGVVSCSSYAHGYFNGYRRLAERADVDAILHLGDYVYEYGSGQYGNLRTYEPDHEMISLQDYRTRHAYYKQDPDLMELHRQFPFITTWDDHESTDNSWRDNANNHTDGLEGDWAQRKAWAQQAYDEWMPIRYPQTGNTNKIWRSFQYGDLAEIFVLDTRLYDRDEPDAIPTTPRAREAGRRMLGPEQMAWLQAGLSASSAQWKIIAQQMVFMHWQAVPGTLATGGGQQLNGDAWDGYWEEKMNIINFLRDQQIDDVIFLSGDVHSSWVGDITDDPNNPAAYDPTTGAGAVAVEFTTTSITSPFLIQLPDGEDGFRAINPHIRFLDTEDYGYVLLDLSPTAAQGEYWYVDTITEPSSGERFETAYSTQAGSNTLSTLPVDASAPPQDPPPLAP